MTTCLGVMLGSYLAMKTAAFLEENELFGASEDDDD